jgi:hypothetical protein
MSNQGPGYLFVDCTVVRSPLAPGSTTGWFYVDGTNNPGESTICTLFSFNFNGTAQFTSSFTATGTYDVLVTFPVAELGTYAYVNLECRLPVGSILYGVTSLN